MLFDLSFECLPQGKAYDVCVVGAGAAGIALAKELATQGLQVLIVEAGGRHFESAIHDTYAGESSGLHFDGLLEGRFRGVGGTTTHWGGQILEIDKSIFTPREWVKGGAWPFEKQELQPFYARAVELEALTKASTDAASIWKAIGITEPNLGDDLEIGFSRWCNTTDFAHLHRDVLHGNRDVDLLIHANVTGLIPTDDRSRLRAVACRAPGGERIEVSAKDFVLALGGIETSRMLLQHMEDGTPPPWNHHGQVGKHFQDHPVCDIGALLPSNPSRAAKYFGYSAHAGFRYHPKYRLDASAQRRLRTLDVSATVSLTQGGVDDLAKGFKTYQRLKRRQWRSIAFEDYVHFASHLPKLMWHKFPLTRSALRSDASSSASFRVEIHCEQAPDNPGSISLSNEMDAYGVRRPIVDWRVTQQEIASIRIFGQLLHDCWRENGWGSLEFAEGVMDSDEVITRRLHESYHHIGGAVMSDSPAHGVVDSDLKIFGLENGYICSSAVFPSAGCVNPTHTVIALAARLASHLRVKRMD